MTVPAAVTRFEVIDHRTPHGLTGVQTGRVFSARGCRIELSYQDGGKTLKVFVDGERVEPSPAPAAVPPLVNYMLSEKWEDRAAAFLSDYARRLRDGSASSWEIPNTVASTLEDIAQRISSFQLRDVPPREDGKPGADGPEVFKAPSTGAVLPLTGDELSAWQTFAKHVWPPDGIPPPFEPCVYYEESLNQTTILLRDCSSCHVRDNATGIDIHRSHYGNDEIVGFTIPGRLRVIQAERAAERVAPSPATLETQEKDMDTRRDKLPGSERQPAASTNTEGSVAPVVIWTYGGLEEVLPDTSRDQEQEK